MARTRTTIRRIDPWSMLKFGFVANLVLLGVYLLVGAVAWAFVRRLELVETICDLAASVGYSECAVDGQALFDTMLVLGLLGVVIQTGIFVFLAFLANLIFDLVGGIAITLDDDRTSGGLIANARRGVGSTVGRSTSTRGTSRSSAGARVGAATGAGRPAPSAGADHTATLTPTGPAPGTTRAPSRSTAAAPSAPRPTATPSRPAPSATPPAPRDGGRPGATRRDDVDDEPLFGGP